MRVTLTTYSEDGEYLQKVIKKNSDDSLTLDVIKSKSKFNVALFGKIDPPKVFCPRILKETAEG